MQTLIIGFLLGVAITLIVTMLTEFYSKDYLDELEDFSDLR